MIILFGAWVELRGAYSHSRMTDVGPYLRAAWAVRIGGDIYWTTDDRGWHYVYPPLLSILMTPLADPPEGRDRAGYLPYRASVGIWYIFTTLIALAGINKLADVMGRMSVNPVVAEGSRFSRQWWALRVIPVLVLLPAIGRSQMRGQVGLLIGFVLCYVAASVLEGKRFRAGLWLSGAICVKIIPVLLLVFAFWRRDWRMILGCLLGLAAGLIIIPVAVMGPMKTARAYESFYREILAAGLRGDAGGSRSGELTGITSTDSNSPVVVIHNILHPEKTKRPSTANPGERMAHWIIAFIMVSMTLLASGWKGRWYSGKVEATINEAVYMGAFIPLMLVTSPVFHPHYVSMAIPLVMLLVALLRERYCHAGMPALWKGLFLFIAASHILTAIDSGFFLYLRDFGLVLFSTIALWGGSLAVARETSYLTTSTSQNLNDSFNAPQ